MRTTVLGLTRARVVVGSTAPVSYGHRVGKILAFACLKPQAAAPGTALEAVIAGQGRAAKLPGEPGYDPQSLRPRMDMEKETVQ